MAVHIAMLSNHNCCYYYYHYYHCYYCYYNYYYYCYYYYYYYYYCYCYCYSILPLLELCQPKSLVLFLLCCSNTAVAELCNYCFDVVFNAVAVVQLLLPLLSAAAWCVHCWGY